MAGQRVRFTLETREARRRFYPDYESGNFEPGAVTLLTHQLPGSSHFIDIGAFTGFYTCLAIKLMPNGVIDSFEMDDVNFEILTRNVELNGGTSRVRLHHRAVGAETGDAIFIPGADRFGAENRLAGGSMLPDHPATRVVRLVCLDDFYSKPPFGALFKIDVEGSELDVLRGMSDLLSSGKSRLLVEVHVRELRLRGQQVADLVRFLRERGFDVFEIQNFRTCDQPNLVDIRSPGRTESDFMLFARGSQL